METRKEDLFIVDFEECGLQAIGKSKGAVCVPKHKIEEISLEYREPGGGWERPEIKIWLDSGNYRSFKGKEARMSADMNTMEEQEKSNLECKRIWAQWMKEIYGDDRHLTKLNSEKFGI